MRKVMMIGAAFVALTGSARADECSSLRVQFEEQRSVTLQAAQEFADFGDMYGNEMIAHRPQLWTAAQRLERQAHSAAMRTVAIGETMLAYRCVADPARFHEFLDILQLRIPGGLTG
jgi:hypothetical protein